MKATPSKRDRQTETKTSLPEKIKELIYQRVHIIQWLPKYTKLNLISDCIAGLTVGLTMIPQSLAYSSLADVAPQFGLYTAFMGSFAYIFFGTIKEVSIGPTSLMSILVYSYTQDKSIDYVVLLCFLSGIIVLLMGIFKLGFLVDFISSPVISGFTSATSVIIILGQLKGVLGLKIKGDGMIDLIRKYYLNIQNIRIGDAILGAVCIVSLFSIKKLTAINVKNQKLKKSLWLLSISRNALTVLTCSCCTVLFVKYKGGAPYILSGDVPSGLPTVKLPPFSTVMNNETVSFIGMLQDLGSGIVVTPIVAVLANVAIAKSFASDKIVDATQEMISLGLCNIFGSFVQAMPATGAFTRSAVAHASGVQTPLQGLYSGGVILLALSFLTPYFCYIPKATLSSVLICAVITLIDYEILPKLMRYNKFDLGVTITTFIVCVLYGVEVGLFIGVVINLLCTLKLWTRPQIETKIVTDKSGEEIIVIKPELGLLFPATDYLTQEIIKQTMNTTNATPVTIDFSNIITLDYSGCQALNSIVKVYKKQCRPIIFENVSPKIYKLLNKIIDLNDVILYRNIESKTDDGDIEMSTLPPNCGLNDKGGEKETETPLLDVKCDKNTKDDKNNNA